MHHALGACPVMLLQLACFTQTIVSSKVLYMLQLCHILMRFRYEQLQNSSSTCQLCSMLLNLCKTLFRFCNTTFITSDTLLHLEYLPHASVAPLTTSIQNDIATIFKISFFWKETFKLSSALRESCKNFSTCCLEIFPYSQTSASWDYAPLFLSCVW